MLSAERKILRCFPGCSGCSWSVICVVEAIKTAVYKAVGIEDPWLGLEKKTLAAVGIVVGRKSGCGRRAPLTVRSGNRHPQGLCPPLLVRDLCYLYVFQRRHPLVVQYSEEILEEVTALEQHWGLDPAHGEAA